MLEYESALRKMALDLTKAETVIKIKDAELEMTKGEARYKAKELITQRKCFDREREQAIQTAEGLEDELETAQSKIAQLEREKIEEAEKTKKRDGSYAVVASSRSYIREGSCQVRGS